MWECDWIRLKKENKAIGTFVEYLDLVSRLKLRKAFFRRRTDAVKLHHLIKDNERIH